MNKTLEMTKKDLRTIMRRRKHLIMIFVYPLLVMLVVGIVFTNAQKKTTVGVFNDDTEEPPFEDAFDNQDIVDMLTNSSYAIIQYSSKDQMISDLEKGGIDGAVYIPDEFDDLLNTPFFQGVVYLYVDNSRPDVAIDIESFVRGVVVTYSDRTITYRLWFASIMLGYVQEGFAELRDFLLYKVTPFVTDPVVNASLNEIIEGFMEVESEESLEGVMQYLNSTARPATMLTEEMAGGEISREETIIPGAICLAIFFTGVINTAGMIVSERERKTLKRLLVSPIRSSSIVLSKAIASQILISIQVGILLFLGLFIFDVPISGPIALVVLIMFLTSVSSIGIGIVISSLASSEEDANSMGLLLTLPMIFLCGIFLPISYLPSWLRGVALLIPLTQGAESLRKTMLLGYGWGDLVGSILLLVGFSAFFIVMGILLLFRRRNY